MMGRELSAAATSALDLFSHARKSLSERSPFESEEALSRVPTLPVALSLFLSRNSSESRRKHRKVQGESPVTPKKAAAVAPGAGPRNIWADTEDYFRPVVLSDVEFLQSKSEGADLDSCFEISPLSSGNVEVEILKEERQVWKEQLQQEELQEMEIDIAEPASEVVPVLEEKEEGSSVPSSSTSLVGLGWLLGSKHKVLLTSERPSKKRKLLGEEAGLERLVAVGPDSGGESNSDSAVCDVCCLSDTDNGLNVLLRCNSCSVFVHKNCYGVTEVPEGKWVCSWCKQENGSVVERQCMLCPRAGGALKPVGRDDGGGSTFAHLFCCQWIPEVYVENTEIMGPIMNMEGIKETRKKLVCHICKLKYGVCIRCSHGTCRTSFHPICAREAKHRMEIWGKSGYDSVELRAFCSKHSVSEDVIGAQLSQNLVPVTVSGASSDPKLLPAALSLNRLPKLNLGCKNNDKFQGTDCGNIDESNMSNISVQSETVEFQDDLISEAPGSAAKNGMGDSNSSNTFNIVIILKKLVDQGKISVSNVASDIGVSSNSLAEALKGENTSFPSEWMPKIVKWLRNAAHLATSGKWLYPQNCDGLKNSARPLPLRRKIISGIRVLKDNNMVVDSSDERLMQMNGGSELLLYETAEKPFVYAGDVKGNNTGNELICSDRDIYVGALDTMEKNVDPFRVQFSHSSPDSHHPGTKGAARPQSMVKKVHICTAENMKLDGSDDAVLKVMNSSARDTSTKNDQTASASNVHPFITKRLLQTDNCLFSKQKFRILENDGQVVDMVSLCTSKMGHCRGNYLNDCTISGLRDQLTEAKKTGTLEYSPDDEVEGEILYLQNKLIDNAIANKHRCEDLIFRVVTNLPHELDSLRKQRWDAVLVNQFLHRVREEKKLGRKEKRHKEAQAVLAAAAAAAAASSRVSSLRKDVHDDIVSAAEAVNVGYGRAGPHSQFLPRTKDALSKLEVLRLSSKQAENSKEKSCDICGRGETMLNNILVCSNCKVAVHLGCYHNLKIPIGPWYCEPCEEMIIQSRDSMAQPVSTHERTCGLCGCTSGAFRKSSDGQCVHAFCSEWILPTFRRGQSYPVDGMETLVRERDICCICQRKVGVCVKCSYGHCQTAFHPMCGRKAGLYLKRVGGSKSQHRAYCEKHSLEQKEKEATPQHGIEVLGRLKQIRVELEKLRLLCERIIKREKVKKELVLCTHDILASKRDFIAFSVLVRSFFPPPDVSSESVTTSLKGHPEDKSCSEGIQRSDDVTVDSTVSSKRHIGYPHQMEIDRRIDDSSTSQRQYTRKTSFRIPSSGKQLLHGRASVPTRNSGDDEDKKSKARKHLETFQKELIMTSDQASMQNQRLPKGFAYVPIGCLSKEKQEPDG